MTIGKPIFMKPGRQIEPLVGIEFKSEMSVMNVSPADLIRIAVLAVRCRIDLIERPPHAICWIPVAGSEIVFGDHTRFSFERGKSLSYQPMACPGTDPLLAGTAELLRHLDVVVNIRPSFPLERNPRVF